MDGWSGWSPFTVYCLPFTLYLRSRRLFDTTLTELAAIAAAAIAGVSSRPKAG
jgi:hypothetical protein